MDERTQAARRDALDDPDMRRRYAALQCGRLGHVWYEILNSSGPFSSHGYAWPVNTVEVCTRCGHTNTALVENVPVGYLDDPPALYTVKVPKFKVHIVMSMGDDDVLTLCRSLIWHNFDKQGFWVLPNVIELLGSEPTCKKCLKTSAEPDMMEVHRSIFTIIWKETAYLAYRQSNNPLKGVLVKNRTKLHHDLAMVLGEFGIKELRSFLLDITLRSVGDRRTELVEFLSSGLETEVECREALMGKAWLMHTVLLKGRIDPQILRFVRFDPSLDGKILYAMVSTIEVAHDGWTGAMHGICPYDPNGEIERMLPNGQIIRTGSVSRKSEEKDIKEFSWKDYLESLGYLLQEAD